MRMPVTHEIRGSNPLRVAKLIESKQIGPMCPGGMFRIGTDCQYGQCVDGMLNRCGLDHFNASVV